MRTILVGLLVLTAIRVFAVELSISVDSVGIARCTVKGDFHGRLIVQQFRWNEWCDVDSLGINRFWGDTCGECYVHLHGGENQFRVMAVPTNPYIYSFYSGVFKTTTSKVCDFDGKCHRIGFTVETYWEMRDQYGLVLKSGYSRIVNTDGLLKGGYFLYYDNKRSEFFKN